MTVLLFLWLSFACSHSFDHVNLNPADGASTSKSRTGLFASAKSSAAAAQKTFTDEAILGFADKLMETDRLLDAARGLERVQNKNLFQEKHHEILDLAESIKNTIADHNSLSWTKQYESHRQNHDTIISFRLQKGEKLKEVHKKTKRSPRLLTTRIETPIEQSLLVPLLAVLGESQLYETWMPKFKRPFKPGLSSAVKIKDLGRPPSQIVSLKIKLPWPLWTREMVLDVRLCDDIDRTQQLIVKLDTLKDQSALPTEHRVVRSPDMGGSLLFRKCPPDHPALVNSSQQQRPRKAENLVLVSMTLSYTPDVPAGWIVHRVAWRRFWIKLLETAEGVRDGKLLGHTKAIQQKRDLYDWVDERIGTMLSNMKK